MDLKNVCRICLRIPKKSINLLENMPILRKIETIASTEIKYSEQISNQICEECLKNINFVFAFRTLLLNTQYDLQSRLETLNRTNYITKRRTKDNLVYQHSLLQVDVISIEYDNVQKQQNNNSKKTTNKNTTRDKRHGNIKYKRKTKLKGSFKCDQCGKMCDTRRKFSSHRLSHRMGVCNVCGAQVTASNLGKHMMIHSEKPCKCKICGAIAKNTNSLRGHMLRHSDEVIICEICGKNYNVRQNYRVHMKSHIDPSYRKKPCEVCGAAITSNHLKQHMLKHTGERPYICPHCNKGLTSSYALKVHIRIHTKEKPYLCKFCPSSFPQRVSLRTHLKKEHGMSLIGDKYTKL